MAGAYAFCRYFQRTPNDPNAPNDPNPPCAVSRLKKIVNLTIGPPSPLYIHAVEVIVELEFRVALKFHLVTLPVVFDFCDVRGREVLLHKL